MVLQVINNKVSSPKSPLALYLYYMEVPPSSPSQSRIMPAGNPSLTCAQCNKSYSSQKSLRRHMNLHRGRYAYNCVECCKGFQNRGAYHAHLASVHNMTDMKVRCPICSAMFTRMDNIKVHMQMTHGTMAPLQGSTYSSKE